MHLLSLNQVGAKSTAITVDIMITLVKLNLGAQHSRHIMLARLICRYGAGTAVYESLPVQQWYNSYDAYMLHGGQPGQMSHIAGSHFCYWAQCCFPACQVAALNPLPPPPPPDPPSSWTWGNDNS